MVDLPCSGGARVSPATQTRALGQKSMSPGQANPLTSFHTTTPRPRGTEDYMGSLSRRGGAVGIGSKMKVVYRAFVDFSRSCLLWRSSLNVTKSNNQPTPLLPIHRSMGQFRRAPAQASRSARTWSFEALTKNPPKWRKLTTRTR